MTRTRSARESSVAPRQAVVATTVAEPVQNVGDAPDPEILHHTEPTGSLPLSRPISPAEELRLLRNENNHLRRQLEQGMYRSPTAELAQPPRKEAKVSEPPEFTGRVSELQNFLMQCEIVFRLRASSFAEDEIKVLYIIGRFREAAQNWAAPIGMDETHPLRHDYQAFKTELQTVFQDTTAQIDAMTRIGKLHQTRSAAEYGAEFSTLASLLQLDEPSKRAFFYNGLKPDIKKALAIHGMPITFNAMLAKAVEVDQVSFMVEKDRRQLTRRSEPNQPARPTIGNTSSAPRQIGKLSQEEKERRKKLGLCYTCGQKGHMSPNCPKRRPDQKGFRQKPRFQTPAPAYSSIAVPPPTSPSPTANIVTPNAPSSRASPESSIRTSPAIYPGNFRARSPLRQEF